MTTETEFKIANIDLRPGDVLVFKLPMWLSEEQRPKAKEVFKEMAHGHEFIILEGGVDLAVMRSAAPSEAENAA